MRGWDEEQRIVKEESENRRDIGRDEDGMGGRIGMRKGKMNDGKEDWEKEKEEEIRSEEKSIV